MTHGQYEQRNPDDAAQEGIYEQTRRHRFVASRGSLDGYRPARDRKSTRLNSSHAKISYAVLCLKKRRERRDPIGRAGGGLDDRSHVAEAARARGPAGRSGSPGGDGAPLRDVRLFFFIDRATTQIYPLPRRGHLAL